MTMITDVTPRRQSAIQASKCAPCAAIRKPIQTVVPGSDVMTSTPTAAPDSLFSLVQPIVRDNRVGASLGETWMPGVAWDGVAHLLASDDAVARRGLIALLTELADHVDDGDGWQGLVLAIVGELEAGKQ